MILTWTVNVLVLLKILCECVFFLKLLISILIWIFYSSAPLPTPASLCSNAKLVWLFIYCYLYILLEHKSHTKSNAIDHLSIQVELSHEVFCLLSAYSNVYFISSVMCMFLYAIGITFLCWFQCNNPFCNCTRTDWDMIHTNLYYLIRFSQVPASTWLNWIR